MLDGGALLVITIVATLAFDYINGFHDSANAIATVVSTRVLSPRQALFMAAVLNFAGALFSTNVAKTVASGLVEVSAATHTVVLAAVIGAIVWNLITWHYGIPSSSSHALIGGLLGAAIVHAGVDVVKWSGLTQKALIPLVASPVAGFILGFAIMTFIVFTMRRAQLGHANSVFRKMQLVSAAAMAFTHGQNDAQKSMGIITLALMGLGAGAVTIDVRGHPVIPLWVVLACAVAMALGTAAGGWRIIRTMGHRIIRLEPVHGFAAETSAASILFLTGHFGMPVSTTHVISGSIFGVGSSKRLSAVRWQVAYNMVAAWALTIPASALVAALAFCALRYVI